VQQEQRHAAVLGRKRRSGGRVAARRVHGGMRGAAPDARRGNAAAGDRDGGGVERKIKSEINIYVYSF
jgi:hypothetical protein